jgi:hypothetical protein
MGHETQGSSGIDHSGAMEIYRRIWGDVSQGIPGGGVKKMLKVINKVWKIIPRAVALAPHFAYS